MTTFHETVAERFHDWNYGHPFILAGFIRALKPDVVVEVGSYRGFCACHMAHAIQMNNKGKLYCIDNWSLTDHVERCGDPRTHFEENIKACGVDGWIEILQGDSDKVKWPDNVDICYIDGWHSYRSAEDDLIRAMNAGARIIALDDTENCVGPRLLVEHFREGDWMQNFDLLEIHSDNGMAILALKEEKRPITFSQEAMDFNSGLDLRPLTIDDQIDHFTKASRVTGIDYSSLYGKTQHDMKP